MVSDIQFMQEALAEAHVSAAAGEVPIGAILVHDGKILARSGNRTIRDNDPTAHAEIIVLREAARRLSNYRLADTTLYVTIEPCSMCAGAIIQARVPSMAPTTPRAAPSAPASKSFPIRASTTKSKSPQASSPPKPPPCSNRFSPRADNKLPSPLRGDLTGVVNGSSPPAPPCPAG